VTATYEASIVTLLSADATLTAILVGGVYAYAFPGRKGISRKYLPDAYANTSNNPGEDPTYTMLPFCIVKALDAKPQGQIVMAGPSRTTMSTITPVCIWIYDNGDAGYDTIDNAYNRIYADLHTQRVAGSFQILWQPSTQLNQRDADLNDAAFYRADFNVYGTQPIP